jgi:hypothetical protein
MQLIPNEGDAEDDDWDELWELEDGSEEDEMDLT